MQSGSPKRLYTREDIVTRGIPAANIPGLINCDSPTFDEEMKKLSGKAQATYTHEELFTRWVNWVEYIEAPVDAAYEYLANPYSVEEFTATLRKIEHVGGGIYRGLDSIVPATSIYLRFDAFPEARVVDTVCAWDQGLELWMRYHMRLLDAQPTIGKPGTILLWNNCRHPYYDRDSSAPAHVAEPRKRADRLWVGDFWPHFYSIHALEAGNLRRVLEHRFRA